MGPFTLAVDAKSSSVSSSEASDRKVHDLVVPKKFFASVNVKDEKPFDLLRILFEGAIAGATAGVVVETALYPIDTIKTRLQAARGGGKIILKGLYSGLAGNLAGVLPYSNDQFSNMVGIFQCSLEYAPVSDTRAQVRATLLCDTLILIGTSYDSASAVFVGVYEPAKQKLLRIFPENLSAVAHLTAGAFGGLAASCIRVPTEVVKQRMQTGQFASAPDALRLIVSKEGFKGLYAGYGSFLLRDLPFDAIQFCIYEQLRIGYKLAAKRDLNDPENAVIGAFAGALTGAITTPLDVIKTRLMVQGSGNQYKGIINCVQTIVREEGPAALLKGIGPRVLWIGIGGSIFFSVLESTKRLLAETRPQDQNRR
ncbi:S-adenosylmethionine carrier 1, chloroplastic/mitochondrial [Orobanche minor]